MEWGSGGRCRVGVEGHTRGVSAVRMEASVKSSYFSILLESASHRDIFWVAFGENR